MYRREYFQQTVGKSIRFYVSKLLEAVFISLFVTFLVSLALGCRPIYINGDSMNASIPRGTVIYIKKVDVEDLKIGDAITFRLSDSGMPTTHRIYAFDGDKFITRGDYAGATPDRTPVAYEQIWGKHWFTFPYLGEIFRYIMTGIGTINIILFCLGFIGVLYYFRPNWKYYEPYEQDNISTMH